MFFGYTLIGLAFQLKKCGGYLDDRLVRDVFRLHFDRPGVPAEEVQADLITMSADHDGAIWPQSTEQNPLMLKRQEYSVSKLTEAVRARKLRYEPKAGCVVRRIGFVVRQLCGRPLSRH
jgi:hypothetical protein